MVTYKVTLLSEEHDINSTIDCNDDVFVLDAAEEQGIELPIYLNGKNEVMDGWHRFHAYYYSGMTCIPFYRNKLIRNHGFCWKKGLEGKRRLRTKTW